MSFTALNALQWRKMLEKGYGSRRRRLLDRRSPTCLSLIVPATSDAVHRDFFRLSGNDHHSDRQAPDRRYLPFFLSKFIHFNMTAGVVQVACFSSEIWRANWGSISCLTHTQGLLLSYIRWDWICLTVKKAGWASSLKLETFRTDFKNMDSYTLKQPLPAAASCK